MTVSVTVTTSSSSTATETSETVTASPAAVTDSSDDSGIKEGYQGKSYSGLESNNEASQKVKEGGASASKNWMPMSWIGLLGLGVGVII